MGFYARERTVSSVNKDTSAATPSNCTVLWGRGGGENTVILGLSTDHLDLDLKLQSMKSPKWTECIFNFVKPWARGKEYSSSEKAVSLASQL